MQAEEWVDRLIAAVRRRIGGKKLSAAEELSDVSAGYLRKAQGTTRNIMLIKFLRICENAEIDPAEIFAEVFPAPERKLDFGIPIPKRPVPNIVRRVRERLEQSEEGASTIPRHWLEWLDELRYDKPRRALKLLEDTLDLVKLEDLPLALGVWASTCRFFFRYEEAFLACIEGLEIARAQHDPLGEVDLLQRVSFLVASMAANYQAALSVSEQAAVLCSRSGDLSRLGQILVDQGQFLFYLDRHDESRTCLEVALRFLDETERRHQTAALHTMGHLSQVTGSSEDALVICKQLQPLIRGRFERGKLQWLEGCALADLKRWEPSFKGFEDAWASLLPMSPIDAALSACDHVDALLSSGSVAEAQARAQILRKVLEPLEANLLASAAIRDLLRCEQEGKQLTATFLLEIKNRIENSRRAFTRRHS